MYQISSSRVFMLVAYRCNRTQRESITILGDAFVLKFSAPHAAECHRSATTPPPVISALHFNQQARRAFSHCGYPNCHLRRTSDHRPVPVPCTSALLNRQTHRNLPTRPAGGAEVGGDGQRGRQSADSRLTGTVRQPHDSRGQLTHRRGVSTARVNRWHSLEEVCCIRRIGENL